MAHWWSTAGLALQPWLRKVPEGLQAVLAQASSRLPGASEVKDVALIAYIEDKLIYKLTLNPDYILLLFLLLFLFFY